MSSQSGVEPVLAAVVVGYALAAAIPAGLAWYTTRTRPASATARAFAATMAGITVWAGAYFVRLFAPEWAGFGLTVLAFVGITTTPVAVLLFALRYTDREQYVTPGTTALLLVVPLMTLVLLATTRSHGLFYTSFRVVQVGPLSTTSATSGPWFWVHTAYSFGTLAAASVLLVGFGARQRRLYRRQAVLIVLAVVVAWATNVAYLTGHTPVPILDLTPVGLALSGALLALAVFRTRLIDVTPVARDAVLEALDDVVIVLEGGRTVDVNAAAETLLGPDTPVGKPAVAVLPEALTAALEATGMEDAGASPRTNGSGSTSHAASGDGGAPSANGSGNWLEDPLATAGEERSESGQVIELSRGDETRYYRVRTLPLQTLGEGPATETDDGDRTDSAPALTPGAAKAPRATVLLLTDVTPQRERLRQLRKQNERLEEFAAAAAHDLRNPLNVIDGYLELAREDPDPEHLDRIDEATGRMSRLVEDLLSLGRRGRLVESAVPVSLEAAAERAWSGIETEGATLQVESGDPVPADTDRLVQLLENLLVNAVQQAGGGESVTVTVGRMPDGFYVADDGPGIPDEDRERVFDYGFTTREAGSGFGLAIVETVADAHGWDVRVVESEAGGARFEVTGVGRFDREGETWLAEP
ncbi:sensor histidine kinase [Haloglomus salinum]|uniref:sensor histidine kinase n=1 Tax=Haloglomus salinum TaxID=2962673 RepID=UPI0020C9A1FA|nr:histidine kinase N-terminal 7TM domain-containing protein [Haloglomus salinum]